MKIGMKKYIVWTPSLLLMIIIFMFSAQPATISGEISGSIAYQIASIVSWCSGQALTEQEKVALAEKIDYPLRKVAHMSEYTLLGLAIAYAVQKKKYWLVQLLGSLYAATDEIHQIFVPGRAGLFSDVLIDSFGVLLGWLLYRLIRQKIKYNS